MKRVLKIFSFVFLIVAMALFVGCGLSQQDSHETITVQAAASLKESMDEIAGNFKKAKGLSDDQLVINYAGSGTLRQQIEGGAPANLFISADEKNMKLLQDKNLVSDVKPLVKNELVLIVPAGHAPVSMENIKEQGRIVIGNIDTVPAGRYAQQALQKANLWDQVQGQLVFAKDVRAVLAYISQGAGDVGFVYKTDAIAGGDKLQITDRTGDDSHDPIVYPVGIISKNDSKLTREFYDYLMSQDAQAILEAHGFVSAAK